ncbi:MAG: glycosyltransferase family 4 protein [Candidatus Dormibacteria bacterium]|jgi:glycosyltransferase involved in cell wall biosynthesis
MPDHRRDLAMALTYYAPYVSGLSDAARAIAEGLAGRGWRVTVVATRHQPDLPARETLNGVDVVRTPVIARIGKGTVSPAFVPAAARAAGRSRALLLHLPLLEAGLIASLVRRTPIVTMYQCDVSLPAGLANRGQTAVIDLSSRVACRRSRAVVASSADYAQASRISTSLLPRLRVIPPPCRLRSGGKPAFRDTPGLHVGFLGRLVEEKGVEYLVEGFRRLTDPAARLLLAGDFAAVAGGSVVERVRQGAAGDPRIRLLGFLPDAQVADFYASIDVLVLPSINPLEAFGIVQAQALMLGIPVIASDLPGVRVPLTEVDLGTLIPPRDAAAIAGALSAPLPAARQRQTASVRARELWMADAVVERNATLLREIGGMDPAGAQSFGP